MTLWAILIVMTSIAASFLAALVLRRLHQHPEAACDIEVCCDHLAQPEKDAAAGVLAGEQAAAVRTEIRRRILAASDRSRSTSLMRLSLGERNVAVAANSAIVVLGLVALYTWDGSPNLPVSSGRIGAPTQSAASAVDQLAAATDQIAGLPQQPFQPGLGSVDEMIERLTDRLSRNPNDPEGWRMLGWSYFNTEHFAQAANAYAKAIELDPQNSDFRSSRGEALVRAAGGVVTDEAKQAFTDALGLAPMDPRARYFLGLAKESAKDVSDAEAAQPADRTAMIQAMVERLASRLHQSPRDVDGWIRLMRSRQVLGDKDAAEQAFRHALDVFKDAPQEQARISSAAMELGLVK